MDLRSITFLSGSWDFPSGSEAANGDRSTRNKIAIRGALPNHYSIGPLDGGGLAVRTIFLLSVQEDGHRLVYTIRLDDEFDWSGNYLQTSQFLPGCTRDGAQRRPRIDTQRNRASPRAAHILPGAFLPRLSNRNHRYRNLGLRGPTAPTRSLNARGHRCKT